MSIPENMHTDELIERLSWYTTLKRMQELEMIDVEFTDEDFMERIRHELNKRTPRPKDLT